MLEEEVMALFEQNLLSSFSINSIANNLGKAYPHVHSVVSSMIKNQSLLLNKEGRSNLCSINLNNHSVIPKLFSATNKRLSSNPALTTIKERVGELSQKIPILFSFLYGKNPLETINNPSLIIIIPDWIKEEEPLSTTIRKELGLPSTTIIKSSELLSFINNHPTTILSSPLPLWGVENFFSFFSKNTSWLKAIFWTEQRKRRENKNAPFKTNIDDWINKNYQDPTRLLGELSQNLASAIREQKENKNPKKDQKKKRVTGQKKRVRKQGVGKKNHKIKKKNQKRRGGDTNR